MNLHKKKIIELINRLGYKHSQWKVFADFIEIAAITISNSIDIKNFDEREKRYLQIVKEYTKEEFEIFSSIFAELVLALEQEITDILGEIYMELNLSNKWSGQVFTPIQLSKLMGKISVKGIKESIEKDGFVTVSEPTCGGGSILIGLALAIQEEGFNYQDSMVVTAVDLDIKAVYMCYVQLSLLGIPGVILHGNTIAVEVFSQWKTPTYILGDWSFKEKNNRVRKAIKEDLKLVV